MPQSNKFNYTDKQKWPAAHLEAGYEKRGAGLKTAEARAWATFRLFGDGKKTGSGRNHN